MTFEDWWEQNKRNFHDSRYTYLEFIQSAWEAGRLNGMERAAEICWASVNGPEMLGAAAWRSGELIRAEAASLHAASR